MELELKNPDEELVLKEEIDQLASQISERLRTEGNYKAVIAEKDVPDWPELGSRISLSIHASGSWLTENDERTPSSLSQILIEYASVKRDDFLGMEKMFWQEYRDLCLDELIVFSDKFTDDFISWGVRYTEAQESYVAENMVGLMIDLKADMVRTLGELPF